MFVYWWHFFFSVFWLISSSVFFSLTYTLINAVFFLFFVPQLVVLFHGPDESIDGTTIASRNNIDGCTWMGKFTRWHKHLYTRHSLINQKKKYIVCACICGYFNLLLLFVSSKYNLDIERKKIIVHFPGLFNKICSTMQIRCIHCCCCCFSAVIRILVKLRTRHLAFGSIVQK